MQLFNDSLTTRFNTLERNIKSNCLSLIESTKKISLKLQKKYLKS